MSKCEICSKEFENKKNPMARACSRSCNARLVSRERKEKFKKNQKPNCECEICKKKFYLSPSKAQKRKFCSRSCFRQGSWGEGNAGWKGGIRKHSEGYVYRKAPNHPSADKEGYVLEHRLVMEGLLSRFLDKKEVVHHINGIKNDNSPSNLELFSSHSQHVKHNHVGKEGWFGRKKLDQEKQKKVLDKKGEFREIQ